MPKDPESLGSGIGPLLADFIPLLPSGARRAGAARVMAARTDDDPSFLVEHPIKTQLLALGLGGAGGALTQDQHKGVQLGATLGPISLVQLLRHLELKKIQKSYDSKKRKRLRELDQEELFDDGSFGWGGSSRLGAVNAYETMRDRKYKGFGSLSEAGDALQLAANSISPLVGASFIPVAAGIDNRSADALLKKSADFTDQRNSPSIPLYLAAAALSSAGLSGARHWARSEDANTPSLGSDKWSGMIGDISGTAPLLLGTKDRDNAYFYKPKTELEAKQFLRGTAGLEDHTKSSPVNSILGSKKDKVQRLLRYGSIVADSDTGAPTIAHEAGHAKIENTPGVMRFMQRHLYPHSQWIAPLSGAGSMAAGLASGNPWAGAALGTGIGALANIGMVAPEAGASYHALKHLKGLGDGSLSSEGRKDLTSALSTYLAAAVLPSTLAGAAGGWISGRREDGEDDEEDGQEKGASRTGEVARKAVEVPKEFIEWWKKAPWISFPWMKNYKEFNRKMAEEGGENLMIPRAAFQSKGYAGPVGAALVGGDVAGRVTGLKDPPEGWGSHMPWSRWQGLSEKERAKEVLQDLVQEEREETWEDLQEGLLPKSASADKLHQLWKALRSAKSIRSQMGADSADRYLMDQVGSVYRAAEGRFFKNPRVAALGIKPRMKSQTIDNLMKDLVDPDSAAPEQPKKMVQETFDFFKEGAHPDLPNLVQAKQHSDDKDYRQKNLMLRIMMEAQPEAWVVDSDDGKGIVGLTHTPTNFRIHMPKDRVYPQVLQQQQPQKQPQEE